MLELDQARDEGSAHRVAVAQHQAELAWHYGAVTGHQGERHRHSVVRPGACDRGRVQHVVITRGQDLVGAEVGVGILVLLGDALRSAVALAYVLVELERRRVRPARVGAVDLAVPVSLAAAAARPARAGRGPVRYSSRDDLLVARGAGV